MNKFRSLKVRALELSENGSYFGCKASQIAVIALKDHALVANNGLVQASLVDVANQFVERFFIKRLPDLPKPGLFTLVKQNGLLIRLSC